MTTAFKEFSRTYKAFCDKFPRHPLTEEIRSRLAGGKFPSDQWLRAHTDRMRELMVPCWLRSAEFPGSGDRDEDSP